MAQPTASKQRISTALKKIYPAANCAKRNQAVLDLLFPPKKK